MPHTSLLAQSTAEHGGSGPGPETWECSSYTPQLGLCRNLELEESERLAKQNIKDIIACGFDESRTFIFTDFNYLGGAFSRNIKRIQRCFLSLGKACRQYQAHAEVPETSSVKHDSVILRDIPQ